MQTITTSPKNPTARVAYSHTREGPLGWEGRRLDNHLLEVARLASTFAEEFGAADWAYLIGVLHDLGKYHPEFQDYLLKDIGVLRGNEVGEEAGRVDHSTLGAVYAVKHVHPFCRAIAYTIAGHHAGLPDWMTAEEVSRCLAKRLEEQEPRLDACVASATEILPHIPGLPTSRPSQGAIVSQWIRMVFSCLTDADFLDTESFLNTRRSYARSRFPSLQELDAQLSAFLREKRQASPKTKVNEIRNYVQDLCYQKARLAPGLFSLTVPTGGGKTLSSTALGLRHAVLHGKRRVIYVIPFTSIVEQTADELRKIFGDDAVIEHHSNFDTRRETLSSRLATENWDAPIVVTTAVQFFESLFAARPGRCRKLHNILNAVVIFDEAQTLPVPFLKPICWALQDLCDHYGVTAILSTATQPALGAQKTADYTFDGLRDVREIVDDPNRLYRALQRVRLELPQDFNQKTGWDEVAGWLRNSDTAALCVVNTREEARDLFQMLPAGRTIHLSALLCGQHRSDVIRSIKERLRKGENIIVVATNVIEAGVDVDFPRVFRAMAGLDAIAQTAGRCNREGKQAYGVVRVFIPDTDGLPPFIRDSTASAFKVLRRHGSDSLMPEHFREYFEDLYWRKGDKLDEMNIIDDLKDDRQVRFSFRTAAEKFRMIEDNYVPVVVRYSEGAQLIEQLRAEEPKRQLLRRLQRYIVTVPQKYLADLVEDEEVVEVHEGIFVQNSRDLYHPTLGLLADPDSRFTIRHGDQP